MEAAEGELGTDDLQALRQQLSAEDRCRIPKENRVIEDKTKLRREMEHFLEIIAKMPTLQPLEARVGKALEGGNLQYTGLVAFYNMAMDLLNEELNLLITPTKTAREVELEKQLASRKSGKEIELEKALTGLSEQHLTLKDDFERFRARAKAEFDAFAGRANEELLKRLVPVSDNFMRCMAAANSAPNSDAVIDGVRMIHRQFEDVLKHCGLVPIPSVGEEFDPRVHEALMQVETAEVPAGCVCEEVQTGYYLAGKVFRPALVKVARAPG